MGYPKKRTKKAKPPTPELFTPALLSRLAARAEALELLKVSAELHTANVVPKTVHCQKLS